MFKREFNDGTKILTRNITMNHEIYITVKEYMIKHQCTFSEAIGSLVLQRDWRYPA